MFVCLCVFVCVCVCFCVCAYVCVPSFLCESSTFNPIYQIKALIYLASRTVRAFFVAKSQPFADSAAVWGLTGTHFVYHFPPSTGTHRGPTLCNIGKPYTGTQIVALSVFSSALSTHFWNKSTAVRGSGIQLGGCYVHNECAAVQAELSYGSLLFMSCFTCFS